MARYEDDALVIETTQLVGRFTGTQGNALSDRSTVVETYRRAGPHRSEIIEVNPYAGTYPDSSYLPEMAAGGPAEQVAWNFTAVQPNSFSSRNISGVQRLANGNTLGVAGRHGHVFQVTPEGEVVWEYIVPIVRGTDADADPSEIYKTVMSDTEDNSIFKARWIAPDHPGLAGKDLTPQGKITDMMLE